MPASPQLPSCVKGAHGCPESQPGYGHIGHQPNQGATGPSGWPHGQGAWPEYLNSPLVRHEERPPKFDYKVEHRPCAKHANADGMSRRNCARLDCPDCVSESDEDSDSTRWPEWSTTTSCGIAGVQAAVGGAADVERPDPWLEGWSREELQLEQSRDPVIALFIERVLKGDPAPSRSEMNGLGEGAWALYNRYDSLQVPAGLLYVCLPHAVSTSLVTLRLVMPAPLRKAVFNFLHSSRPAGHLGYDRDDWDDHLPYVMMAYRVTRQDSTGCSPNLMMSGREARLPVEIMVR